MESFFSYETARNTLVMTGYWFLICLDILWIGYLVKSFVKWLVKKVKGRFQKKQPTESVNTEK